MHRVRRTRIGVVTTELLSPLLLLLLLRDRRSRTVHGIAIAWHRYCRPRQRRPACNDNNIIIINSYNSINIITVAINTTHDDHHHHHRSHQHHS